MMCRLYMLEMQAPTSWPSISLVRLMSPFRREPIAASHSDGQPNSVHTTEEHTRTGVSHATLPYIFRLGPRSAKSPVPLAGSGREGMPSMPWL